MKKTLLALSLMMLAQNSLAINSGQENEGLPLFQKACGDLSGFCLNGAATCRKWLTQIGCDASSPACRDGKSSMALVPENGQAAQDLNSILEEKGQNAYVCTEGRLDQSGQFQVHSVEWATEPAPPAPWVSQ